MLTIHRVRSIREADGVSGDAVVVDGDRIRDVGTYEELVAQAGPGARTREWDGHLTPGRFEPDAVSLLQAHYWPDPREADTLGTEPLSGHALRDLDLSDTRWGHSARRGVQRLLAHGTTAVAGPFTHPAVRVAVERSPVRVLHAPRPHPLTPSSAADFAVYAEPEGVCLVTVIAGRMVFRRA
ncbi:imidazolonepropionase-like domain-containing protein [Streptomyces sp. NPDC087440]|uniref:imidazolonepropionase-like domain-containing protein n=1 Tax=Streptomyces sp. NPDC087440 TaxID=3365790 RepID=UPI0037F8A770